MPRILIANTSFELGGVEMFFMQVCKQYLARGYGCDFITLSDSYSLLEDLSISQDNVEVIFPDEKGKPSFVRTLFKWWKVYQAINRRDYEAVFVGLYLPAMPIWVSNYLFRKQRVFFLLQTPDYIVRHSWFWKSGLMKRGNTFIIALSNYLRDSHVKLFPSYKSQFRTCILPVNTQRFYPRDQQECRAILGLPADKKIVGICSRLSPEKGFHIIAAALREFTNPDIICVVYGNGPMGAELNDLIEEYQLGERLFIYAPRKDTEIIYNAFDIYWQAGKGPSLGLSTLEAFASGIPNIIVTRDAEERVMAEDTLGGRLAGKYTSNEAVEIARDIESLIYSPDLPVMQKEARKLAEEVYNWDSFLNCLMPLHQKARGL